MHFAHAVPLLMIGSTAVLSSAIPKINVTHAPAEILDLQSVAPHKYNITWGFLGPINPIRLSRVHARQLPTDDIGRRYSVDDPGFLSVLTRALLDRLVAFPYDGESFWTQDVANAIVDRDYNRIFTMPQQSKVEDREKAEKVAREKVEREEKMRIKAEEKAKKKAEKEEEKRLHEEAKARGKEAEEAEEKRLKEQKKAEKEEKERIEDEEKAKEKERKRLEKQERKRLEEQQIEEARKFLAERRQYMRTPHGMQQVWAPMKKHKPNNPLIDI